jgi:hypothetical protein
MIDDGEHVVKNVRIGFVEIEPLLEDRLVVEMQGSPLPS